MAEEVISWVTPVLPVSRERLTGLHQVLATIDMGRGSHILLPLAKIPMLHFASLVLFDEGAHEEQPLLVFESNFDRPYRKYVETLVTVGRTGLDAIYSYCEGYPGPLAEESAVVAYLESRKRKACLFHIGHPNRSVDEIKGDYELRRSIAHVIETDKELRNLSPPDLRASVRRRANCPHPLRPLWRPWHSSWGEGQVNAPAPLDEIQWLRDRWPWDRAWRFLQLTAIGWLGGIAIVMTMEHCLGAPRTVVSFLLSLGAFALLHYSSPDARVARGVIAAGVLWLLLWLAFRIPQIDQPHPWLIYAAVATAALIGLIVLSYLNIVRRLAPTRPFPPVDAERVRTLLDAEDLPRHSIYNHVAGLSVLKERFRWIRRLRTRLVLFLLNLFYRTQFVKGQLLTIPSIHFAQWSLVDDRRLLFVTNYDGGADSYLDDFFNSLAKGVAFIWHDTTIFPRTTDPRRLKLWVRQGQTLAGVRYRAAVYDGLTVGDINNNTYIRRRLLRGQGQASARRWLRRFATIPVEPSPFERFLVWLLERLRLRN